MFVCNVTKLSCAFCNPVCISRRSDGKGDYLTDNKPTYVCEICGTPHKTIAARANCELACYQKKATEEENEMKRQRRYDEIMSLGETLVKKINEYDRDYKRTILFMGVDFRNFNHLFYELYKTNGLSKCE